MNSPEDVKSRAKKLGKILNSMGFSVSHGKCLEILSKLDGFSDWNTYFASFKSETKSTLLPIPTGWSSVGENLEHYEIGLDPTSIHNGHRPAIIRSKKTIGDNAGGFATLMQTCLADSYVGKRVKLRAQIKAVNCEGAVTVWLRADSENAGKHLAFDNMETRKTNGPLKGTTGWETRSIVLDIPQEAVRLAYGFYIRGPGTGYAANFSIETVGPEVSVTSDQPTPLPQPSNLNFEIAGI